MDNPPRCAYVPCSEPVVTTLTHKKDTYPLCFDHLCVAAQEGLINEERALRAETRYAILAGTPSSVKTPSLLKVRLDELRAVIRDPSQRPPGRTPCRGSTPSRARGVSPRPA